MHRSESEGVTSPCVEVRRVVFEYLDDELPAPQRAVIVEHLTICGPCDGFFSFERTFLAVVRRRVPAGHASAELRERIRAALADRMRADPPS